MAKVAVSLRDIPERFDITEKFDLKIADIAKHRKLTRKTICDADRMIKNRKVRFKGAISDVNRAIFLVDEMRLQNFNYALLIGHKPFKHN